MIIRREYPVLNYSSTATALSEVTPLFIFYYNKYADEFNFEKIENEYNLLDVAKKLDFSLKNAGFLAKLYEIEALRLTRDKKIAAGLLNYRLYSKDILFENKFLWYKFKAGINLYNELKKQDIKELHWTAGITNSKTVADLRMHTTKGIFDISVKHYSCLSERICTKELAAYHFIFNESLFDGTKKNRRQLYDKHSDVIEGKFNDFSKKDILNKFSTLIENNNYEITQTLANMIMHQEYRNAHNLLVFNTSFNYCHDITKALEDRANALLTAKKTVYFEDPSTMIIQHEYNNSIIEHVLLYKHNKKTFTLYVKI